MAEGLVFDRVEIQQGGSRLIGLDRRIAPGEVLTLMGPSGVGKSTLLSAVIGQLGPAFTLSGRLLLNGQDITQRAPNARGVGILFQDALLFSHLSVGSNLGFGLPSGGTRAQRRARVEQALESVGLGGFHDRDPATLSGGQRARVALMRMLLSEPKALVLDEPFTGLDASLRDHIRTLVFDHAKARALPVLLVTHDRADAKAAGGEIIDLARVRN